MARALDYGAWMGGKPSGWVSKREKSCVVQWGKSTGFKAKTFPFVKYNNCPLATEEAAVDYRDTMSLMHGLTTNLYRLVTERETGTVWYEMAIGSGKTTIFDVADLPVVLEHRTSAVKERKRWYAIMKPHGKNVRLHMRLTGWAFVHHIDGDSLNNRRANLQLSTHLLNNRDRLKRPRSNTGVIGVTLLKQSNGGRLTYTYRAYISSSNNNDEEKHRADFSVTKLGKEEAFRQAVEWRKKQEKALGYVLRESTMRAYGPEDTETPGSNPRSLIDWQKQ